MKSRKLLALLLAFLLIVAIISGCTAKTDSDDSATDDKTETKDTKETKDDAAKDEEAPVDSEPIKVTIANDDGASVTFPEGEDMYNNMWTKVWLEELNIEVETLWVSNEYTTKLNLMIAAQDLPDVFRTNTVQFNQLVVAELIQDITQVYEEYASPKIRKMMEVDDPDVFQIVWRDDKLMAIPQLHYGYTTSTRFMWLKKNWMEEAGSPAVDTLEQLEDLMDTFMEKYGADYAMPLDKDLQGFYKMAATWHAYPEIWVDDGSGNIIYGSTMPEMKTMLAKWAQWYDDGILRKDFATLDFDTMEADILNGIVGMQAGENWYSWVIADTYKNTGDGTWLEAYELPSVDGDPVIHPIIFPNNAYNVVNKDYDHPEVLIKLINHYSYQLNEAVANGDKTIEEVLPFSENNIHHVTGPFKVMFRSYEDTKEVVAAVEAGEENPQFKSGYAYNYYNEVMKWHNDKDPTALGRTLQMGQTRSSLNIAVGYIDDGLIVMSKLWGETPQALLDYGSNLDELLKTGFTKIIMGVEPVDYFDDLIEEWEAAGGAEATAAVNEMYGDK